MANYNSFKKINTEAIVDDSIAASDIGTGQVTTAKIADANITAAKVSSDVSQLGKNLIQNGKFEVNQRNSSGQRSQIVKEKNNL